MNSSEMGNVISGVKKDQYIEDPEVIDGPDPDGHTSPGECARMQRVYVKATWPIFYIEGVRGACSGESLNGCCCRYKRRAS